MRLLAAIGLASLASITCLAQTTFMGITPGRSMKADVEGVFGQPVTSVSNKLIEYRDASAEGASKVYVQYRDESSAAIVERLELICNPQARCRFTQDLRTTNIRPVFRKVLKPDSRYRTVTYYDGPAFLVETLISDAPVDRGSRQASERRFSIYSKELFDNAVPKTGCTGTIFGVWETSHGRMTITKVNETISGRYSKGNNTFTLTPGWSRSKRWSYNGDWKDGTGAGAMYLEFPSNDDNAPNDSFTGEWYPSHTVAEIKAMNPKPAGEPWSGKCLP